nr:beta-actin [Ipomoea batatas]
MVLEWVKAGFAGDDAPRAVFPSICWTPSSYWSDGWQWARRMLMLYVGDEAQSERGILTLKYPLSMELSTTGMTWRKIWHQYRSTMNFVWLQKSTQSAAHRSSLNPKANREKMTQIMFEDFQCPAMYVAMTRQCLSFNASGRTTGYCSGLWRWCQSQTVPFTRLCLPHAIAAFWIWQDVNLTDNLNEDSDWERGLLLSPPLQGAWKFGGTTMFGGIADRMSKRRSTTALAPSSMKIKVVARLRGSTVYGLEDLFWLPEHIPTENASKELHAGKETSGEIYTSCAMEKQLLLGTSRLGIFSSSANIHAIIGSRIMKGPRSATRAQAPIFMCSESAND